MIPRILLFFSSSSSIARKIGTGFSTTYSAISFRPKRILKITSIISALFLNCIIILHCNFALAASGRVITVDGMNLWTTVTGSQLGDSGTGYLYADITENDKYHEITSKIGYVQPFYWNNNSVLYTDLAIQSLTDNLRSASNQRESTGDPFIIVTHSWGTVLTYIVLEKNPDIVVDKLITMGSPLNIIGDTSLNPMHILIGEYTYSRLLLQGITVIDSLPNVLEWNNYWSECDIVSAYISAIGENIEIHPSSSDLRECHSWYFEDATTWNEILEDVLDTPHPLQISYSPIPASAPEEITFNATGSLTNDNDATYFWNFGDDWRQNGSNEITHYYKQPGTYNVSLALTDSSGNSYMKTEPVTIRPSQIDVCYPYYESLIRTFTTPEKSLIESYVWDFGGDGVIIPDNDDCDCTITYEYSESGYYNVKLTATLEDGTVLSPSEQGIFVGPGNRSIYGHTIYGDETWYKGGTYDVQGNITVNTGASLTIESGAEIRLAYGAIISVNGTLKATGATFKSADENNPGGGINLNSGSDDSVIKDCNFNHLMGTNYNCVLWIDGSPTVTGCTISDCSSYYGIYTGGSGYPVISRCTISGIRYDGIVVSSAASPIVTNNIITGNTDYGLLYLGTLTLFAENNDWGDPSGPYDPSDDRATGGLYNPGGKGDKVSDNVDYKPWAVFGDFDNDGMNDKWEIKYFGDTSRNSTGDYDGDGLTDLDEYKRGSNPTLKDTDGDGMPDGWEVQHGLNPLVNDASADPDKDGYTNLQEYQQGGNPNSSDSPFPWELFYPAFVGK
jgi:parallel beta-helix repeat protein